MRFKDNYVSESDKTKPENKDKRVISDEVFAILEMLEYIGRRLQ